ncbi:MAG: QueT transporter family protein [Clostridia bacterium]|nr:QueT transporter family protein [Clostridia bacterium]MBR5976311.1 QueT transporter family protein [Clostridia bacterium]MBR6479370.1 QueT transporter family protein [Clostridia bacterium]MBR6512914.1 QueT transporter family protein [Clostridia bacterium]
MNKSNMGKATGQLTQGAIIAAMYAALTYLQGFILPGSTTAAVQFRVSEALNVLALFTPAAIPGLTVGCIIANIYSIGQGLPLDMIFGSLATLGATLCIRLLRNVKVKDYPILSMLMPALWNGVIVGWEIETFFIAGKFHFSDFLLQGSLVALGELGVMFILGSALYIALKKRNINKLLGE